MLISKGQKMMHASFIKKYLNMLKDIKKVLSIWKKMSHSMIKNSFLKISLLFKLIYRFNRILTKISKSTGGQAEFKMERGKIVKAYWRRKSRLRWRISSIWKLIKKIIIIKRIYIGLGINIQSSTKNGEKINFYTYR